MQKSKKQQVVMRLSQIFQEMPFIVVSKHAGLDVKSLNGLRREIANAEGKCVVVKNNLAKVAVRGTKYEDKLAHLFTGPVALTCCSADVAVISKILVKFCSANDKLELLAAATVDSVFTPSDVKQLASLPSAGELRAQLCGVMTSPLSAMLRVLCAVPTEVVGVIDAYADKCVAVNGAC